MNKYLVRVWVEEVVFNLRSVWVEADSFESIKTMSNNDFFTAIYDYVDVIDTDWSSPEPDLWDMTSIELDEEHPDNIIPSDEKPDVEDIDPNVGRGK